MRRVGARRRGASVALALGLLCGTFGGPAAAQAAPEISLLTFAPGEIYWQRFGHNAILVRDAARGAARVYNYGIFDFQQKNFFVNFARGRMLYRLDEAPLDWTLRLYAAEGRWAVEQQLALSAAQRRSLAEFLAWNARPENAEYRYDYFVANCSTKARDALDRGLDGQLRAALEPRPGTTTFRSEVLRLMRPEPLLMLGMDLGLGPRVDQPLSQWQEGFIPMRLMEALRDVQVDDGSGGLRPLVSAERQLLPARLPETPAQPRVLGWPSLLAGLGLAALFAVTSRVRRLGAVLAGSYVLLCGLAGAVLLLGWLATDHWGMAANRNLLLLNPLWWALLPAMWRRAAAPGKAARGCAGLLAGLIVAAIPLAAFGLQPNGHWVALFAPGQLLLLAPILFRRARAQVLYDGSSRSSRRSRPGQAS
ncbi:DUF4105 domain-containing protein [Fontimonas sp. SYSU GA230001]|uniref:lipoprotein N-acyltransferase Lnb domain-containing protein n=1 Tax=Fontimonas sp. SYSU GA230001 TaxID=3142450 RepID=UPI0032B4AF15